MSNTENTAPFHSIFERAELNLLSDVPMDSSGDIYTDDHKTCLSTIAQGIEITENILNRAIMKTSLKKFSIVKKIIFLTRPIKTNTQSHNEADDYLLLGG